MGNEKIELTNVKKQGDLSIGLKGKDGKALDFGYGKTITEDMVDRDKLIQAMEHGNLKSFIYKGWVIKGKVNVNNQIFGSPTEFKKIEVPTVEKEVPQIRKVNDEVQVIPATNKDPKMNSLGIAVDCTETKPVATAVTPAVTTKAIVAEQKINNEIDKAIDTAVDNLKVITDETVKAAVDTAIAEVETKIKEEDFL
jgi:hypothetical protein